MRIISGKHKGKKLKEFKTYSVRPTSDRAREALFNILGNIEGFEFLDLCAGTGAVGLEAISRGAKATFVDISKESVSIIKSNLISTKEDGEVFITDAKSYLIRNLKKFDIIFYDPPYEQENIQDILTVTCNFNRLAEGGTFIYEHKADKPSVQVEGFKLYDTRKYGIAIFDFYRIEK